MRILVLKDLADVKRPPRLIGTAVALGDFARASSRSRFGVDKDGSWLGRTARTRGANDGQRGVGGFVLSPQPKRPPFRADGLQSPQSITTKENILELLMIPDSEVGLRDGGLVTIGGALGLLERGLCSGAANRSDANNRKSDGGRGPNEQLRDAAWHDSLHPCQLHGGQSTSSEILTPVTDVTGSDEISGAYFARDFGGWDMQVPTATNIAGPREPPPGPPSAAMGSFIPLRSCQNPTGSVARSSRLAGFAAGST